VAQGVEQASVHRGLMPKADKAGHVKKAAMVAALSETGNVCKACEAAEVGRSTHYLWLQEDEDYRKAVSDAMETASDILEAEARRRAHDGVDEPVFYQGMECGTVRKYSDTLLIFLLKGAKPDKFRERTSVIVEDPVKALAKLLGVSAEELPT
jgi:hypothetical protein